jgi:hypothetical protein
VGAALLRPGEELACSAQDFSLTDDQASVRVYLLATANAGGSCKAASGRLQYDFSIDGLKLLASARLEPWSAKPLRRWHALKKRSRRRAHGKARGRSG